MIIGDKDECNLDLFYSDHCGERDIATDKNDGQLMVCAVGALFSRADVI